MTNKKNVSVVLRVSVVVFLSLLFSSAVAKAQTTTAAILGTVTDETGGGTAGKITSTVTSSRQLQFGLKLTF